MHTACEQEYFCTIKFKSVVLVERVYVLTIITYFVKLSHRMALEAH